MKGYLITLPLRLILAGLVLIGLKLFVYDFLWLELISNVQLASAIGFFVGIVLCWFISLVLILGIILVLAIMLVK